MKPNFALGLTDDGITLWQRGSDGWLRVGAVSMDATDMDAQLRGLVKIASALEPAGVFTKLVVPEDQILYCDLPVTARNRDMQGHEIRAQLAGRTPYPVEELDIDWTLSEGVAHVAVVARETLVEAEDFARSLGLNPVSAVAAPKNGGFMQEPFFGPTRGAREIIGDPSLLERDREILREVGLASLPEPELVAAREPEPAKTTELSQADTDKPKEASGKAVPEPVAPAKADKPAEAKAEAPAQETAKPVTPAETTEKPAAAPISKAMDDDAAAARKAALLEKLKAAKASTKALPREPRTTAAPTESKKQGLTAAIPSILSAARSGAAPETASSETESVAFRSRRAGQTAAAPSTPQPKPAATSPDLMEGLRAKLAGAQGASRRKLGELTQALGAVKAGRSDAKSVQAATAAKPAEAQKPAAAEKSAAPAPKKKPAEKAESPYPIKMGPKSASQDRKDPLETLKARAAGGSGGQTSEAERMTIFGARNQASVSASGPNRAVLILSGVGLLLVAAGVWAFYFMATPSVTPEDTAQVELPSDPVAPSPLVMDPASEAGSTESEIAALPEDDIEAALGLEDAAQQLPIDATEPEGSEAMEQATLPPETSVEDAPAAEAEQTTGRVAGMRTSGLLSPQDPVPLPEAPLPPEPFNADELPPLRSELAQAAPEPVTEPEEATETDTAGLPAEAEGEEALEISVTEGTPPVVPPARPVSEVEATEALPDAAEPVLTDPDVVEAAEGSDPASSVEEVAETALPDATPLAEPDEADLDIAVTQGRPAAVPPQRPEGIAPETAAPVIPSAGEDPEAFPPSDPESEVTEPGADQAELTPPPGGVALSMLRPAARPAAVTEAALAALAPEPEFDASDLAVAASLRPGARPAQFAAVVQRALRAAQPRSTTTAPAAVAAAQPAAAPAAVQTARAAVPAAPPIPASASVAREATQARAINLRQVNLIGVMGTASNRRALVRLSNGRVVTVRVGDSLDSGQVTAISDGELRYNRRGRDVVLRIAS
ncbi:MAG: hypothetical protein ACK4NW_06985 [Roseinatronobacter sp.]